MEVVSTKSDSSLGGYVDRSQHTGHRVVIRNPLGVQIKCTGLHMMGIINEEPLFFIRWKIVVISVNLLSNLAAAWA